MGDWHWKMMNYKGYGRSILRIYIQYIDCSPHGIHMVLDGIHRGNYFRGNPIKRTEIGVTVGKFKNGKAVGKDEVTGKMVKDRGDMVMD